MKVNIKTILQEAGNILKEGYLKPQVYDAKERLHLRSEYDLKVDRILKAFYEEHFPDDGIYSEETTEKQSRTGRRWIIDPIDGTAYFIFGEPFFSISIALEEKGEIVEAHVYNPLTGEYFYSDSSCGKSYLNGKEIHVSAVDRLEDSLLAFGFSAHPDKMHYYLEHWKEPMTRCKKALPWIGPALSICNVARGRIDGFIDKGCSMEGQAAASLILKNAGGCLRNIEGEGYSFRSKGGIFLNNPIDFI